jgi:hypothetical protein
VLETFPKFPIGNKGTVEYNSCVEEANKYKSLAFNWLHSSSQRTENVILNFDKVFQR